ncbi:MAG TPA: hypothetical protein PLM41_14155 [Saprospiraceae bacterium]|nr:hypothetical protein [Saprospiraceae bacterium]
MKNKLSVIFFFSLLFCVSAGAQVPCAYNTNLPAFMPDGFTGNFTIEVAGATNPVLGENGQAICGVHLQFTHEYLGDLVIQLTSPLGQSITLIGPFVFAGPTDLTTWDVHFVPCAVAASPDPGFNPNWSNNQPWDLFQTYTGSYHPFNGCLETLTGPVNGTWTLTITDGQALDQGELLAFGIDFCDPAGLACSDCAANAGQLNQPNLTLCSGNASVNLTPTYISPASVPPPAEYGYTYIVSSAADDVIAAFDPALNLGQLNPGNYTVCGMSYRADAAGQIPAPNGSLTTAQLRTQLNVSMPPFCGNITGNCVNVLVQPEAQDTVLTTSVCASDCVLFYGDLYCTQGTYTKNVTENGCTFTAQLILTVAQPPSTIFVQDTICAGACSVIPGFENACTAGTYTQMLPAAQPGLCDTLQVLFLTVVSTSAGIAADATVLSCANDTLILHSAPGVGVSAQIWTYLNTGAVQYGDTCVVTQPGNYVLTTVITPSAGLPECPQTDTILITYDTTLIHPVAHGGILGCGDSVVILQVLAPGAGLSYHWAGPDGFTSTLQYPVVQTAGTYGVTVSNNEGCLGFTTAVVLPEGTEPVVTIMADAPSCTSSGTVLWASTNIGNPLFIWAGPGIPAPNIYSQHPQVYSPGVYYVTVTNLTSLCTATASIIVTFAEIPYITTAQIVQPSGGQPNGMIDISVSGGSGPWLYTWHTNGQTISTSEDISGLYPGSYSFIVTSFNGCSDTATYFLTNNLIDGGYTSVTTGPNITIRSNPGPMPVLAPFTGILPLARLRVYDSGGRLIWEEMTEEGSSEHPIDLKGAPEGLYFLEMQGGAEPLWFKIVLQR